jgi:hypothetical protein
MADFHAAAFRVEATVPVGHPLCGGWIKPAVKVVDPLWATGAVILGGDRPIVLCAVDWTGLCNDAHVMFRERLAAAAGTAPASVAVQCVHPHNAPFADLAGQRLVEKHATGGSIVDVKWFEQTAARVADAVGEAVKRRRPLTHLACGSAKVDKVASNRRIVVDGKVSGWRGSATRDPRLRELPEGLIDPLLRSVALLDGDRRIAVLHYYATHPMSYYGDGNVTSDFVGIARDRRTKDDGAPHVYFTGAAGNVAAGKYNDGSPDNRPVLAERIHAAMVESEKSLQRVAVEAIDWRAEPVHLPPRSDADDDKLEATVADAKATLANRHRAAMKLAYRRRAQTEPIFVTALRCGPVRLLHLPAESFVEYQLFASKIAEPAFVATAAYGDGGPWYIPTDEAFPQGGYEVSAAFVDPGAEKVLARAVGKVL